MSNHPNIISLGCFSSCEEIATGISASIAGTWKALVKFNGVILEKEFSAIEGQELKIDNTWPEGLLLTMQLLKPDGSIYDNNFYTFKNKITIPV
jgi:hypothetical protein